MNKSVIHCMLLFQPLSLLKDFSHFWKIQDASAVFSSLDIHHALQCLKISTVYMFKMLPEFEISEYLSKCDNFVKFRGHSKIVLFCCFTHFSRIKVYERMPVLTCIDGSSAVCTLECQFCLFDKSFKILGFSDSLLMSSSRISKL